MHPKILIQTFDKTKIATAISEAEKCSSGEIRVWVSHRRGGDALAGARRRFLRLGMARTVQRNAILIYFVPFAQTFALWGDVGVHEKCGDEFWQATTLSISQRLKAGQFAEAVSGAVRDVGAMLAQHFPRGSVASSDSK